MKKFLFAIAFFCQFKGYGQNIVYTANIPYDTLATRGDSFNLDLNKDGKTDFIIKLLSVYQFCSCSADFFPEVVMTPIAGSEILNSSGDVIPFTYNDSISNECEIWSGDSNQVVLAPSLFCNETFDCITTGWYPWNFNNDYYAGLRIPIGGHFLCGWVRVKISVIQTPDSFYSAVIIKDYAYNDSADMKIFAGYMATGIVDESYNNSFFKIYPNPVTNQLTIHTTSFNNEAVVVSVMNVMGQEASPQAPLQRKGEDAVIDVSGLSAGVYFVQLKSESTSVAKMFVKE